MIARATYMQGKPEKVDDVVRFFKETVIPASRKIKGFKEGYMLVNRQNGRITGMTFWETQQGIQESASNATRFIPQIAQIVGATQEPMVETYEVAVAEVMTPAGVK